MKKLTIALGLLACGAMSQAATVAVSSLPTVDGADIANLVTPASTSDILNGDRPAVGQTFTTGSNSGGYELTSLTIYNTRTVTTSGGTWNFRLGTVSGTSFSQVVADSVTVGNNALALSGAGGDWITFTLTTPQTLSANTVYGVDLVRAGGGNYLNWGENANTNYADGQSYTSPPNGAGGPTVSLANNDRIFHLDMAAVPEPSTLGLIGLSALVLIRRRRA